MAMTKYIGVKIIDAEPAQAADADKRGQYPIGADGYKVTYEDGYTSWSPKEVFDKAYRPVDRLSFGLAVEALKLGKKVCRAGWKYQCCVRLLDGKGMYLTFKPGYPKGIPANETHAKVHNCNVGDIIKYDPYIEMKTAGDTFVPWLASQTDVLAEDWMLVS